MDPDYLAEQPLILVVDDQALMRKILRGALTTAGFRVETVGSGEEALALCTKVTPELIILDAVMEGIDGFETCLELRRRPEFAYLPILMMTLLNSSESISRAFEVGVTDFITKPINNQLLIFRLRYMLKAYGTVQALEFSRQRLAAAQAMARIGEWEWDPASDELLWSDAAAEILATPWTTKFHLEGFLSLVHPLDAPAIRAKLRSLAETGGAMEMECRVGITDSTSIFLHIQAQYRRGNGPWSKVLGTIQDISVQRHLQEEASRATHLAALGELSAGIGHEINNPTGVLLLDLPIIQKAFDDIAPVLEEHYRREGTFEFAGLPYPAMRDEIPVMLAEMVENAQRIKHIVDELKDFAAPLDPVKELRPVDLNLVVRKAQTLAAHQIKSATAHFKVHYAGHKVTVAGEFYKLEQVVINLLLNACQALRKRSESLHVTVASDGPRQLLIVEDEGVGIPPEQLAIITSPFYTTRRNEGGTGLGLSVSARIVEQHGGQLHFSSIPGQGTRVTVSLPAYCEVGK